MGSLRPEVAGFEVIAHLLAVAVGADFQQLSAVSSGVSDARRVMDHSKTTLFRTVLFVDEVHRWNKAQQEILLPAIEDGSITLIGATTENPYHSLVSPLLSRCLLLRLEPLEAEEIRGLLEIAVLEGFAATDSYSIGQLGPEHAREAFARIDRPGIDAFAVPGANFPTMGSIAAWEREFGKPVVTSTQAAVWAMARQLGGEPIPGCGRLLDRLPGD